jgi:hypothetical protein
MRHQTFSHSSSWCPPLVFAHDYDVAPDVVWASTSWPATILHGGKLDGAPELVVEVLSPGKKNI